MKGNPTNDSASLAGSRQGLQDLIVNGACLCMIVPLQNCQIKDGII